MITRIVILVLSFSPLLHAMPGKNQGNRRKRNAQEMNLSPIVTPVAALPDIVPVIAFDQHCFSFDSNYFINPVLFQNPSDTTDAESHSVKELIEEEILESPSNTNLLEKLNEVIVPFIIRYLSVSDVVSLKRVSKSLYSKYADRVFHSERLELQHVWPKYFKDPTFFQTLSSQTSLAMIQKLNLSTDMLKFLDRNVITTAFPCLEELHMKGWQLTPIDMNFLENHFPIELRNLKTFSLEVNSPPFMVKPISLSLFPILKFLQNSFHSLENVSIKIPTELEGQIIADIFEACPSLKTLNIKSEIRPIKFNWDRAFSSHVFHQLKSLSLPFEPQFTSKMILLFRNPQAIPKSLEKLEIYDSNFLRSHIISPTGLTGNQNLLQAFVNVFISHPPTKMKLAIFPFDKSQKSTIKGKAHNSNMKPRAQAMQTYLTQDTQIYVFRDSPSQPLEENLSLQEENLLNLFNSIKNQRCGYKHCFFWKELSEAEVRLILHAMLLVPHADVNFDFPEIKVLKISEELNTVKRKSPLYHIFRKSKITDQSFFLSKTASTFESAIIDKFIISFLSLPKSRLEVMIIKKYMNYQNLMHFFQSLRSHKFPELQKVNFSNDINQTSSLKTFNIPNVNFTLQEWQNLNQELILCVQNNCFSKFKKFTMSLQEETYKALTQQHREVLKNGFFANRFSGYFFDTKVGAVFQDIQNLIKANQTSIKINDEMLEDNEDYLSSLICFSVMENFLKKFQLIIVKLHLNKIQNYENGKNLLFSLIDVIQPYLIKSIQIFHDPKIQKDEDLLNRMIEKIQTRPLSYINSMILTNVTVVELEKVFVLLISGSLQVMEELVLENMNLNEIQQVIQEYLKDQKLYRLKKLFFLNCQLNAEIILVLSQAYTAGDLNPDFVLNFNVANHREMVNLESENLRNADLYLTIWFPHHRN